MILEATVAAISYLALALFLGQLVAAGFLSPRGEPERLRQVLLTGATASLVLFLLISAGALTLQGSKLQPGFPSFELLWRYLTLTQSGRVWLIREVYGALLALFIVFLARSGAPLLRTTVFLALPLVASRSLMSHAIAVRENTALAVTADAIHAIVTALWAGGLIALWRALAISRKQPSQPISWTAEIVKRFSRLALASVTLIVATGFYQSWIQVGGLPMLVRTDYGKVLLAKLAFFSLMLAIGAINLFSTKPRLARSNEISAQTATQMALRRVGWESVLGVAIFGATGLLTVLPPAVHALHQVGPVLASAGPQQLQPAEGATVKILSPKPEQIFSSDRVPLKFDLVKGKQGHHVHAYVDGQLMGMFESTEGTLNGIAPGRHTLELRVVAADHQTELDAKDRVEFIVK